MALSYRTTGPWGNGLLRPLTWVEADYNLYGIDQRVLALETNGVEAVGISDFEVVANDFYVHLTNYGVRGPFPLPTVQYNPRGIWLPSTHYYVNDLVSHAGVLYVVPWEHDSDLIFDPGANDGGGHDFYRVFFEAPETAIPASGATGMALVKLSDDDYDIGWAFGLAPSGGSAGQVLTKNSSTSFDYDWASPSSLSSAGLAIKAVSTTYTFVHTTTLVPNGDDGKYLRVTGTGFLTVPTNSAQAFPVGTEITAIALTSGGFSIQPAVAGPPEVPTLNVQSGYQRKAAGQFSVVIFKKVDTDVWDVFGGLLPT